MTNLHPLPNNHFGLVVPEDAIEITLLGETGLGKPNIVYCAPTGMPFPTHMYDEVKLPPGTWTLVGKAEEMSEEVKSQCTANGLDLKTTVILKKEI